MPRSSAELFAAFGKRNLLSCLTQNANRLTVSLQWEASTGELLVDQVRDSIAASISEVEIMSRRSV